jgi:hypothetical protein
LNNEKQTIMKRTIMKNRYLRHISICILVAAISGSMMAQSQERIEKFKEEQRKYYTEKLELTAEESKAFWPVYDDFMNRKMKLVEDERNIWSYAHKNAENLSKKEILETQEKAFNLEMEQLELEREYYQEKFHEVLPARKVLKLGKVEWDFRRHLLRELRKDGEGRRQGGGSGKGSDSGKPFDGPGSHALGTDGKRPEPLSPAPFF